MSLLVTGSVGIDTVSSPHGHVENVLGGSAVYFALAASQYVRVRLVAVAGDDFPDEFRSVLESHDIDLTGLEIRQDSKTFRWVGRYKGDMNEAETVEVDLNVLAEDAPKVPVSFADTKTVFLANTHPTRQREILAQIASPGLVVCDTMNLWITHERDSLLQTLRLTTGVILNDGEARQLTGIANLIEAGEAILQLGPRFVIIKKGEHGALLVTGDRPVAIPAYPTKIVRDPTGAGDSFAGGVLGFLAVSGADDPQTLRQALVRGTVSASFAIESFSIDRVKDVSRDEIDRRVAEFIGMLRFDECCVS